MRYKILATRPIHVRLRPHSAKTTFQPGEIAKLPEDVAEQYLRLGLVEEVDKEPKAPKAKEAVPAKIGKPKAPLKERVNHVGNVSKPPD